VPSGGSKGPAPASGEGVATGGVALEGLVEETFLVEFSAVFVELLGVVLAAFSGLAADCFGGADFLFSAPKAGLPSQAPQILNAIKRHAGTSILCKLISTFSIFDNQTIKRLSSTYIYIIPQTYQLFGLLELLWTKTGCCNLPCIFLAKRFALAF
jgi:hypothetical protein